MFPAARAVLLSMRASEDFGCAEKLSAADHHSSILYYNNDMISGETRQRLNTTRGNERSESCGSEPVMSFSRIEADSV